LTGRPESARGLQGRLQVLVEGGQSDMGRGSFSRGWSVGPREVTAASDLLLDIRAKCFYVWEPVVVIERLPPPLDLP